MCFSNLPLCLVPYLYEKWHLFLVIFFAQSSSSYDCGLSLSLFISQVREFTGLLGSDPHPPQYSDKKVSPYLCISMSKYPVPTVAYKHDSNTSWELCVRMGAHLYNFYSLTLYHFITSFNVMEFLSPFKNREILKHTDASPGVSYFHIPSRSKMIILMCANFMLGRLYPTCSIILLDDAYNKILMWTYCTYPANVFT